MSENTQNADYITDFNFFCDVITRSTLCSPCKTHLIKRFIDERTAVARNQQTGWQKTKQEMPSFWGFMKESAARGTVSGLRQVAKAAEPLWDSLIFGNQPFNDLLTFVGDRYGRSWHEFTIDARPSKDFQVDWQKLNLTCAKLDTLHHPELRRKRFNDWGLEFIQPSTFKPVRRIGNPGDDFAVSEWQAKVLFACQGAYTLQDLEEGRDYAAFARMHASRLSVVDQPEVPECKCPDRLPGRIGSYAVQAADAEDDFVTSLSLRV